MTNAFLRDVSFANGDVVLAGVLAIPRSGRPVGGVVMLGGSGPADRHNDSYFTPIRDHLVNAGIVVLSYDKRGVGGSSGDWRTATLDELASDAIAALRYIRANGRVRAETVGLFGHSEGGWVALRAAAREDPPWVVTNSCPGMTPALQERHALAGALQRSGVAQDEIDKAMDRYDHIVDAGRRDCDLHEVEHLMSFPDMPPAFVDYWADLDEHLWEFLKRKNDHDPLPDAAQLRSPHLAIFGGADQLVPVTESIRLFSTVACGPDRSPTATLTTMTFPGANHRILVYSGSTLAPEYLTTLSRWITTRCEDPTH
jgi:uncharacterized protein